MRETEYTEATQTFTVDYLSVTGRGTLNLDTDGSAAAFPGGKMPPFSARPYFLPAAK
jgi:hypothetical protein